MWKTTKKRRITPPSCIVRVENERLITAGRVPAGRAALFLLASCATATMWTTKQNKRTTRSAHRTPFFGTTGSPTVRRYSL